MRATHLSLLFTVAVLVVIPVVANAQCSGAITDYALLNAPATWTAYGTFAGGQSESFGIQVTAGHSYTLTVLEYGSSTGRGLDFTITPPSSGVTASKDVSSFDPVLTTAATGAGTTTTYGQRYAFIPSATGTAVFCLTNNDSANTNYATLMAAETTLASTRWENSVGFTSWGFTNTTGSTVTGYLTIYNEGGTQLAQTTVSIPANGTTFATTTTVSGIPASSDGSVFFAPLAPYGAIVADAFMVLPGAPYTVPFVAVARGSGGF